MCNRKNPNLTVIKWDVHVFCRLLWKNHSAGKWRSNTAYIILVKIKIYSNDNLIVFKPNSVFSGTRKEGSDGIPLSDFHDNWKD